MARYPKYRKGKLLIFYPRNNPEIAANGQGVLGRVFVKGERRHTMFMVVPRALTPPSEGKSGG
jgi:hypothetical protein